MFGRCDLCGGPGTTGHYCPAMVRNCQRCGGHGLGDVTHVCPAVSPSVTIITPQIVYVQPIIVISPPQPQPFYTTEFYTTTYLSSAAA